MLESSEFMNTAVTDEDWVCDLGHRVPDLYTIATVGLIVGTAIFSLFADFKGRKPAFLFAVVVVVTFQLIQIRITRLNSETYRDVQYCIEEIAFCITMTSNKLKHKFFYLLLHETLNLVALLSNTDF